MTLRARTRDEFIVQQWDAGFSIDHLAVLLGVSRQDVERVIAAHSTRLCAPKRREDRP